MSMSRSDGLRPGQPGSVVVPVAVVAMQVRARRRRRRHDSDGRARAGCASHVAVAAAGAKLPATVPSAKLAAAMIAPGHSARPPCCGRATTTVSRCRVGEVYGGRIGAHAQARFLRDPARTYRAAAGIFRPLHPVAYPGWPGSMCAGRPLTRVTGIASTRKEKCERATRSATARTHLLAASGDCVGFTHPDRAHRAAGGGRGRARVFFNGGRWASSPQPHQRADPRHRSDRLDRVGPERPAGRVLAAGCRSRPRASGSTTTWAAGCAGVYAKLDAHAAMFGKHDPGLREA